MQYALSKFRQVAALSLAVLLTACDPDPVPCANSVTGTDCTTQTTSTETVATGLQLADEARASTYFTASPPFSGSQVPTSADLSANMPVAGSQGPQQSCVAWAVAYGLKTYQERIERQWDLSIQHTFSPAYVYNQINKGVDGGSYFDQALEVVRTQGVASLALMPYQPGDFRTQPSSAARSEAAAYKIERWGRVDPKSVAEIKAHLSAGTPVLIGANVDEGFHQLRANTVWRSAQGQQLGGHAMLLVGYDDAKHAFKLLNSWSASWGSNGYGWIDYDYFPSAVLEAYVTLDVRGTPTTPTNPTNPPTPTTKTIAEIIAGTSLSITSANFNAVVPVNLQAIQFNGSLNIPSGGNASTMQIVLYFYFALPGGAKGFPVGSLMPQYATAQGAAATGIPQTQFPTNGTSRTWQAYMPYNAFNVQRGFPVTLITTNLMAEPVLWVDGFPVRTFAPMYFYVNL